MQIVDNAVDYRSIFWNVPYNIAQIPILKRLKFWFAKISLSCTRKIKLLLRSSIVFCKTNTNENHTALFSLRLPLAASLNIHALSSSRLGFFETLSTSNLHWSNWKAKVDCCWTRGTDDGKPTYAQVDNRFSIRNRQCWNAVRVSLWSPKILAAC